MTPTPAVVVAVVAAKAVVCLALSIGWICMVGWLTAGSHDVVNDDDDGGDDGEGIDNNDNDDHDEDITANNEDDSGDTDNDDGGTPAQAQKETQEFQARRLRTAARQRWHKPPSVVAEHNRPVFGGDKRA